MNWIKLSVQLIDDLAALSATNPTNNFISPVADVHGDSWIAADALTDLRTYAHYADWLATLTPTAEQPQWPEASE